MCYWPGAGTHTHLSHRPKPGCPLENSAHHRHHRHHHPELQAPLVVDMLWTCEQRGGCRGCPLEARAGPRRASPHLVPGADNTSRGPQGAGVHTQNRPCPQVQGPIWSLPAPVVGTPS